MSNALREYRRDLALAALEQCVDPVTAGDLTEQMGTLAQAEGHPAYCWRTLNGPEVAGVLRALEGEGAVVRDGERRDGRAGRETPLWRLSAHMRGQVPTTVLPPSRSELEDGDAEELPLQAVAPPAGASAEELYGDMSRPQLYAMLEVSDRLAGVQARYLRELQETTSWARSKLAEVGLG